MQLLLPVQLYDGWSLYVVDVAKRHMLVMDPSETSEPGHEVRNKHKDNADKVINGLREAVHECFDDWVIPPRDRWAVEYNFGMHPGCTGYTLGEKNVLDVIF
jgi:hypothetical protein